jgi:hypothetical protein
VSPPAAIFERYYYVGGGLSIGDRDCSTDKLQAFGVGGGVGLGLDGRSGNGDI